MQSCFSCPEKEMSPEMNPTPPLGPSIQLRSHTQPDFFFSFLSLFFASLMGGKKNSQLLYRGKSSYLHQMRVSIMLPSDTRGCSGALFRLHQHEYCGRGPSSPTNHAWSATAEMVILSTGSTESNISTWEYTKMFNEQNSDEGEQQDMG